MTFSYIVAYLQVKLKNNINNIVKHALLFKQQIYINITQFINTYEMLRETTIRAENERQYINTLNNIHKQQLKNKMRKNKSNSNIYFYIMIKTIVYYIHASDAIIYVYNKYGGN